MSQLKLVNHLINSGVLKSPQITNAFKKINRTDFVLPEYIEEAYGDYPLSIGYGQTISQPTTVAFMLEQLQPQIKDKILDIGSGSGWTTALLGYIVGSQGKVYGIERIPELVEFGKNNLAKYKMPWTQIVLAQDLELPDQAPFDKILVSAAAEELPEELIEQLKVNGRLIIPVQNSIWKINKIARDKIQQQEFPGFVFVPLQ